MKVYFTLLLLLSSTIVFGQNQSDSSVTEVKPTPNPWTKSWILSLQGNQASYRDWSKGGVNSIAFVSGTRFQIKYTGQLYSNTSRLALRFGQTNQEDVGIQKTEDLIQLSNRTNYFLHDEALSAFFEVGFRTQFADGFDEETGELISTFMAPGYLTESFGLSYEPSENFTTQLGLGLKQTFVETDSLDRFYGLEEDEDIRTEGGISFGFTFKQKLFEDFSYETDFNTFTNLLLPITSTDIIMTNIFTGRINDFMTSTIELSFIYDDDFSKVLQVKQLIAVGLSVRIL